MQRMSDAMPNLFVQRQLRQPPGEAAPVRTGGAALEYRLLHHAWPRAGDRLAVYSGFGSGEARFSRVFHWVLDPDSGRPWLTAEAISVSFDLEARRILTLSEDQLAAARKSWIADLGL